MTELNIQNPYDRERYHVLQRANHYANIRHGAALSAYTVAPSRKSERRVMYRERKLNRSQRELDAFQRMIQRQQTE